LVKGSMQYNNYKYNHKTKLFQNLWRKYQQNWREK
jgi:hypothetical protein